MSLFTAIPRPGYPPAEYDQRFMNDFVRAFDTLIQQLVYSLPPVISHQVFTPVLADATTGGNTAAVTTTTGLYSCCGPIVMCEMKFAGIDTTGMTGANDLVVRGLPLPIATSSLGVGNVLLSNATLSTGTHFLMQENSTYGKIAQSNGSGDLDYLTVSELVSTTATVLVSVIYQTDWSA